MALGDQSKALRIVSINKGWDPNVIPARKDPNGHEWPEENIGAFNKAPDPWKLGAQTVGQLPEGIRDSYQTEAPDVSDSGGFNHPDANRETKDRSTSGADPFAGMGSM